MKRRVNIPIAALAVLVIALLGGCKDDSSYSSNPPANNNTPNTVTMVGSTFSPSTITVSVNTTITWLNNDGVRHTSTSDSTGWDTGDMPPGSSRTTTFTTAGTFRYHCTYHRAMGMTGTVVVR